MNESNLRKFSAQLNIRLSGYKTPAGWISAPCPLASYLHAKRRDSHPSFAVCVNDNGVSSYTCMSCHDHGTFNRLAFRLAYFRKDISIKEIANAIQRQEIAGYSPNDWAETSEPSRVSTEINANSDLYPSFIEYPFARAYLKARNISVNTALALGLRADSDRGRVLFPVYDSRRKFRGFSGRAIELPSIPRSTQARWRQTDGRNYPKVRDYLGLPKRSLLLGEHQVRVRSGYPVILVEGLFAYARLKQYRIQNVVALLGSATTPEKTKTFIRWNLPVVCLLDNDEAGIAGIYGNHHQDQKVLGLIDYLYEEVPLLLPNWPENKNDPDDLTKPEVVNLIKTAELYTGRKNVKI